MKKLWQRLPRQSLLAALKIFLLMAAVGGAIAFTGQRQQRRQIRKIDVEVLNNRNNHFVDEETVLNMLAAQNQDLLMGKRMQRLNLRKLEHQLMENTFIQQANIAHTISGDMHIAINQVKPLARILVRGGVDQYLGAGGRLVPFNPRFTARVPLIQSRDSSLFQEPEKLRQLTEMMSYIQEDPFLEKQIAYLDVDHEGDMALLLQVGKQRIEMGGMDQYKAKFRKLKVFFRKVLPAKGWNTYEKVNLEYENQIICQ